MDHRGCYELLLIDVEAGKAEEYPIPFPSGGDCPYASILSTGNKFYTHFNSYFTEFDPAKRAFTFFQKTAPQMAMSMTEDDNGVIWSATYPASGVVSFNPKTQELKDYGHVYAQNWAQYPRSIAADDAGWIYFGDGSTAGQIIILDPITGKATPVAPDDQRDHGYGVVYRRNDGKVYGTPFTETKDKWYVFHKGEATLIGAHAQTDAKPIITSHQGLFHQNFPDGRRMKDLDLVERVLIVEDPKAGTSQTIKFDYKSEGAHIMGVATAPDGTICGGTAFPMRFFCYNPKTDSWINRASYGQWNTVGRQGDRFYAGGYGGGFLLEWDPAKPWVATESGKPECNPLFLAQSAPTINRPHKLLTHPDGRTLVVAGTPGYGLTGGGLMFWDRETKQSVILTDKEVIPDQSTVSLVALPNGKLLGGTTTHPGTGGEQKVKEAEMYIMDMASKKIEWRQVVFPGAGEYTDMRSGAKGLIFGFTNGKRFFVFDPVQKKVVHEQATDAEFGPTAYQQGPRVLLADPKTGNMYALFSGCIARIDQESFKIVKVADSPVPINYGGDVLEGRIYFASGSHVYSFKIPD